MTEQDKLDRMNKYLRSLMANEVEDVLASCQRSEWKVTLVVRHPESLEAHVVISNDPNLSEVSEIISKVP